MPHGIMTGASVDLVEMTQELLTLGVGIRRYREWTLRTRIAFSVMAIGIWVANKVAPFTINMVMGEQD